jgi:hypothetical protein
MVAERSVKNKQMSASVFEMELGEGEEVCCSNIHSRERACAKGSAVALTQTKLSSSI